MTIQRGEIYFVDLNPVQGREQAGQRPVLVVSSNAINRLPLVVTIVVGTKGDNVKRDSPTNVRVGSDESGLQLETVFMCFQLRSLDPGQISSSQAGRVGKDVMQKIEDAIRYCLDLDEGPEQS